MGLSPLAHVLDIFEAAEVMLILRFAEPTTLAVGLARFAACRLEAELLMPSVPSVGVEQLSAMQAFSLIGLGHSPSCTVTNSERKLTPQIPCHAPEENGRNKRTKLFS
jgi:hypothetical protein